MLTKNHEILTIEVEKHIAADAVIQGRYWDGSKGCFIGCLAHSNDASLLEERFGLPLPLVKICESIFEALPEDEAKALFAAIPAAVGRDGKDLSRVYWEFLTSELRALPAMPAEQQRVIDPVIAGIDTLFAGGEWSAAHADAAAAAAYAAAYAADDAAAASARAASARAAAASAAARAAAHAARAAAHAARAAARAADDAAAAARAAASARAAAARAARATHAAAVSRQRDTILKLITEA